MDLRTLIDLPPRRFTLRPSSRVVLVGSCFAEHMGRRLAAALPAGHVETNPFGVLYNPRSICRALELLLGEPLPYDEALFLGRDGLWHSWLHAGCVSAPTAQACRAAVDERLARGREALARADVLFVTLGTAVRYVLHPSGLTVANCHKEPAARFRRVADDVADACSGWPEVLARLAQLNPAATVVFTISPYRYARPSFHHSQLSKAVLLLAVERLVKLAPQAVYFPAYEIVLDELRDYRFYAPDMLHPSEQAADYVAERLAQWCFGPELTAFAAEADRLRRAREHRPLHPDSPQAAAFRARLEADAEAFRRKWGMDI